MQTNVDVKITKCIFLSRRIFDETEIGNAEETMVKYKILT